MFAHIHTELVELEYLLWIALYFLQDKYRFVDVAKIYRPVMATKLEHGKCYVTLPEMAEW